jgi:hypothetical protein
MVPSPDDLQRYIRPHSASHPTSSANITCTKSSSPSAPCSPTLTPTTHLFLKSHTCTRRTAAVTRPQLVNGLENTPSNPPFLSLPKNGWMRPIADYSPFLSRVTVSWRHDILAHWDLIVCGWACKSFFQKRKWFAGRGG